MYKQQCMAAVFCVGSNRQTLNRSRMVVVWPRCRRSNCACLLRRNCVVSDYLVGPRLVHFCLHAGLRYMIKRQGRWESRLPCFPNWGP